MKLFTYGTLTSPRRLEELVGHPLEDPKPAVLKGFRIFHAPPLDYPLILPAPDAEIHGLLWKLEEGDLPAIDHYEGCDEDPPLYFRQRVQVEVEGKPVRAQVYVGNPVGWPDNRLRAEE